MYPVIGHFFIPIHTYGTFLAIAFVMGILSAIYHGKLLGISSDSILDLAVWVMLSAIAGSRIMYILLYPDQFPTYGSWFALHKGGLVFFGGFIVTTIAVIVYSLYYKVRISDLGDLIAPSLAIGHFLGRIGCFFNGCCYGKPTDSIFGIVFPSLRDGIARHPTQLYEAFFLLVTAVCISRIVHARAQKSRFFPGFAWGIYLAAYGIFRFLIEFVRDDDRGGFFTPMQLSVSQCISLLVFAFALIWLWYYRRNANIPKIEMQDNSHEQNT